MFCKGLMAEAVKAFVPYAASIWKFPSVHALVQPENPPSMKVVAGFSYLETITKQLDGYSKLLRIVSFLAAGFLIVIRLSLACFYLCAAGKYTLYHSIVIWFCHYSGIHLVKLPEGKTNRLLCRLGFKGERNTY